MLLTLAFYYHQIKWILPAVYAASIVPTYFVYSIFLRVLSIPLKKKHFHRMDNFLFELFSRQFIYFTLKNVPAKIYFYGDMDCVPGNATSIAIANYQTKFDWLIMSAVANRQNCLGKLRCVISKSLRNIPYFGLIFKMRGFIYDNGQTGKQRSFAKILNQMKQIDFPVWFMIFPENKRFAHKTPQIISLNKKFAIEHQLPVFSHVLLPKVDVTHAALCSFIQRLDTFYDFTIAYTCSNDKTSYSMQAPSMHQIFTDKSLEIHVLMRHFSKEKLMKHLNAHEIGDVDLRDSVVNFLIDVFQQKNVNLENFFLNSPEYVKNSEHEMNNLELFNLQFRNIIPGLVFFTATNLVVIHFILSPARRILVQAYFVGALISCIRI